MTVIISLRNIVFLERCGLTRPNAMQQVGHSFLSNFGLTDLARAGMRAERNRRRDNRALDSS
jgi:hypothetical protein